MLPTVTILRHAEKQLTDGPPRGVDAGGTQDPESLTVRGWQRAGALVGLFAPGAAVGADPVVASPTHLFASRVDAGTTNSRRPIETLEPLSQRLGLAIDEHYLKAQIADLAAAIRGCQGSVVIAWEHKMIPPLAALLIGDPTAIPQAWPDDRFDLLWIFDPDAAGTIYRFRQIPQLLLAGDQSTPI